MKEIILTRNGLAIVDESGKFINSANWAQISLAFMHSEEIYAANGSKFISEEAHDFWVDLKDTITYREFADRL